jgi:hypothetical protein
MHCSLLSKEPSRITRLEIPFLSIPSCRHFPTSREQIVLANSHAGRITRMAGAAYSITSGAVVSGTSTNHSFYLEPAQGFFRPRKIGSGVHKNGPYQTSQVYLTISGFKSAR